MRREFAEGTVCREDKVTRDSELPMADINSILKRMEKSGIMPIVPEAGEFIDVSEVGDFREALERVRLADERFMSLPADIRRHFGDDPAGFLDAVNDPARHQELVDLGLLKASVVAPVAPVAPVGGAVAPGVPAAPPVSK